MNAEVVIPATSNNQVVYSICLEGVKSCRGSTDAPILVVDNMTKEGSVLQKAFENECRTMGIRYHIWHGPFNMSKIWNLGVEMTTAKYVALCNADVTFERHWLENIVELWEENPGYYFMCPTAIGTPVHRSIEDTRWMGNGATVVKRDYGYRFDEFYKGWETDAELLFFLQFNGLMGGAARNAKTKSKPSIIRDAVAELDFGCNGSREYLEKKWNLAPPKESPRFKGWIPNEHWVNPTPPEFLINVIR